jgi:hypothetical protein
LWNIHHVVCLWTLIMTANRVSIGWIHVDQKSTGYLRRREKRVICWTEYLSLHVLVARYADSTRKGKAMSKVRTRTIVLIHQ